MYEKFIIGAFLKDLLINLLFLIWIPIIYFGFQLHQSEARGCALSVLLLLWGGLALLDFVVKWKYYADYFNYLRLGDGYVMEQTCFVEDAYAPTTSALVTATQYLRCADGHVFTLRHRRDFQRIYPKVGRVFRIHYLPRSGLVVDLSLVEPEATSAPKPPLDLSLVSFFTTPYLPYVGSLDARLAR